MFSTYNLELGLHYMLCVLGDDLIGFAPEHII